MADESLRIELCNVLHRLILTRDNHTSQLLCMEVLKQVVSAAEQCLNTKKQEKQRELELENQDTSIYNELDLLGEGGESGEIVPGTSLVYAVLEVCLCVLVLQLPALSPASNSTIVNSLRVTQSPDESGRLISVVISCMENLHKLCSPKGAESILPTVLYLTTGVVKEVATKTITNEAVLANSASVQAALHCLKTLATDRYSKDERCTRWQKLLQSALVKLIDLTKTGSDENKLDEATMMLSIAVFILNAPSAVVTAPNLQYPCINYFGQCLQSSNSVVSIFVYYVLHDVFLMSVAFHPQMPNIACV